MIRKEVFWATPSKLFISKTSQFLIQRLWQRNYSEIRLPGAPKSNLQHVLHLCLNKGVLWVFYDLVPSLVA